MLLHPFFFFFYLYLEELFVTSDDDRDLTNLLCSGTLRRRAACAGARGPGRWAQSGVSPAGAAGRPLSGSRSAAGPRRTPATATVTFHHSDPHKTKTPLLSSTNKLNSDSVWCWLLNVNTGFFDLERGYFVVQCVMCVLHTNPLFINTGDLLMLTWHRFFLCFSNILFLFFLLPCFF